MCELCGPGRTRRFSPSVSPKDVCFACPDNTFLNGDAGCVSCGQDKFSKSPATMCKSCKPGQYRGSLDDHCKSCVRNTFKDPSTRGRCTSCENLAFTIGQGNVGKKSCICIKGASRERGGLDCERCPPGHFKNITGDEPCVAVSENMRATDAADDQVHTTALGEIYAVGKSNGGGLINFARAFVGYEVAVVAKSIGKVLYIILEGLYDALFGSRHNFEQAFHAEGGAQNSSAYREAEEATSAEKTHQEFACPFAGPEEVWELCRSSRIFKVRLCRFRLLRVSIGGFEALVLAQYSMKHESLMPNPKYLRRRCSWRSARMTLKRLSASWLSASTLINFATRSSSVLLSFITFFFA